MIRAKRVSRRVLEEYKNGKMPKELAVDLLQRLNSHEEIAIIGMAAQSAQHRNTEEIWEFLCDRKTMIRRLSKKRRELVRPVLSQNLRREQFAKGAYIEGIDLFDPEVFGYTRDEADQLSPAIRLGLVTAYRALEDAGMIGSAGKEKRMGVYVGNHFTKDTLTSYLSLHQKKNPQSLFETMLLNWSSGLSTRISHAFNLKGPSNVIDGSCASSSMAIFQACSAIRSGECTTAIAGGLLIDMMPVRVETDQSWAFFHGDHEITRLYDMNPGGAYFGEGVGFVVLKELRRAVEDGDRIHAVLCSEGHSNNGSDGYYTQSSSEDIADLVRDTIRLAGVKAEEIQLLMGEGYPNKLEEGLELSGLSAGFRSFTQKRQFCGLSNLAGSLGYLQSAIGVFNLIMACQALKKQKLPPTYHFVAPTDTFSFVRSPFYVLDQIRQWKTEEGALRKAAVHSYGYGGINLFFILREVHPQEQHRHVPEEEREDLCIFSAKSRLSLERMVAEIIEYCALSPDETIGNISAHRALCRYEYDEYRLAVLAHNASELRSRLLSFRFLNEPEKRIYYGEQTEGVKRRKKNRQSPQGATNQDLAEQFVQGIDFQWEMMESWRGRRAYDIPGYPFDEKACWFLRGSRERKDTIASKQRASVQTCSDGHPSDGRKK